MYHDAFKYSSIENVIFISWSSAGASEHSLVASYIAI